MNRERYAPLPILFKSIAYEKDCNAHRRRNERRKWYIDL